MGFSFCMMNFGDEPYNAFCGTALYLSSGRETFTCGV